MAADAQEAETSKYEMLETDKSDMEAEYEEKIGQMEERNQQVTSPTPACPSDGRSIAQERIRRYNKTA